MNTARILSVVVLLALVVALTVATWGVAPFYLGLVAVHYRLVRLVPLSPPTASLVTGLTLAAWVLVANLYWGRPLDGVAVLVFVGVTLVVTAGCIVARAYATWLLRGWRSKARFQDPIDP